MIDSVLWNEGWIGEFDPPLIISIEVQINNDTALSVELLDDVRKSTPYSTFSL